MPRDYDLSLFIDNLAARRPADWREGIWIFHQNEGLLARAISKTESPELKLSQRRLSREKHFKVELAVREFGTRIDIELPPGQQFRPAPFTPP